MVWDAGPGVNGGAGSLLERGGAIVGNGMLKVRLQAPWFLKLTGICGFLFTRRERIAVIWIWYTLCPIMAPACVR